MPTHSRLDVRAGSEPVLAAGVAVAQTLAPSSAAHAAELAPASASTTIATDRKGRADTTGFPRG